MMHDVDQDHWRALETELDAWADRDETATLWWRDDDASTPGAQLDRLIEIAPRLPLALAVIPQPAGENLAHRLESARHVSVLQHGYAHANHAGAGRKKAEYGAEREAGAMLEEIERGRRHLDSLFNGVSRPVFVPPWNRIDGNLASRLGDVGFRALSTLGPAEANARPARINVHVDIIDWPGTKRFAGEKRAIGEIVANLGARREGRLRRNEATGLMTHHRDHDEDAWIFLERLFDVTERHPAAVWLDIDALLEATP